MTPGFLCSLYPRAHGPCQPGISAFSPEITPHLAPEPVTITHLCKFCTRRLIRCQSTVPGRSLPGFQSELPCQDRDGKARIPSIEQDRRAACSWNFLPLSSVVESVQSGGEVKAGISSLKSRKGFGLSSVNTSASLPNPITPTWRENTVIPKSSSGPALTSGASRSMRSPTGPDRL